MERSQAELPSQRTERQGALIARLAGRVRGDLALVAIDAVLVAVAYVSVLVLRFDGLVPARQWMALPRFLAVAVALHLLINAGWRLYGQMWRHASVAEARRVLAAGFSTTALLFAAALLWGRQPPVSVVILGGGTATMLAGAVRFQSRLFAFKRGIDRRIGVRVAVVGAGEAGAAIVREMLREQTGLHPVAVFDDDLRTRGRRLAGVPVVGGIDELGDAIGRLSIQHVLLAVPSADVALVRRVATQAEAAGVPVKVLPHVRDWLGGQASVRDVRDLRIEDLLGRRQVPIDLPAVEEVLADRRVLITGAGGSIGSEIARQVAACRPAVLLLLDNDETHLHDAAAELRGPVHQILADIRDEAAVNAVFSEFRPQIVFHAAAHKHVPMLERHPCEAVLTNVAGTANLVEAARRSGVERFVFISTDKAVQPSSVMGATKRLGEHIVIEGAPESSRYCAVRFGNVLGSRGSVIPTFARQIAAGGPVTVTDPRMTRFFMSVQEAVQLVLQAAAFSRGGEVFMLEMGEAVNILNLAERMIRLSGRNVGTDVAVRITGPRPGEKLVEELRGPGEDAHPTPHPSIIHLFPQRVDEAWLRSSVKRLVGLARLRRTNGVTELLFNLSTLEPGAAAAEVVDLVEFERSKSWSPSSS
ncbi:MAG TPA: nucleoside-diphosphate sugar epimerase/dehydratase [Acidimicrobiales bacterium]|nr:nucleoside-diphosphate sugar epimerase/dehydratase [Acidimicrobiales bacterium]